MILRKTLLFALSIAACSSLFADPMNHKTHLPSELPAGGEWLIIDGTRNFSYAMARLLISQNIPCTLVVKPSDMMHYDMRFEDKSLITHFELDYTKESCRKKLIEIGKGKKHLYLDPEHGTFLEWHDTLPRIAMNALIAARDNKLTVYYAGRVFPMDKTEPITASSAYVSSENLTEQGKTLIKIEKMIKFMTDRKLCKVRTIRTSYPFGPGMYDYLLSTSFKEIPEIGRLTWLYTTKKKFQFCYTHDAAHLTHIVSQQDNPDHYECIPFSGYTLESVTDFGKQIVTCAKGMFRSMSSPLKHRTVNRSRLSLVSKFEPNALRGLDLDDFFRNPAIIDSTDTEKRFGFSATPLNDALMATLEWYATSKDTKGLFVLRDDNFYNEVASRVDDETA